MKVDTVQIPRPVDAVATTAVNGSGNKTAFSSYLQSPTSMEQIFQEASSTYGVDVNLLKAIAKAESDFNPNATSGSGAQGVMQLMPATAASLGVTNSYDPYQNIMGGSKYIGELLDKYDNNTTLALAAYNAGMNNVSKYGGVPPFKETQNYVVKVTGFMNQEMDVPNAAYPTNSVTKVPVTVEAAETPTESVIDQLFSYDDYLDFLELYSKVQTVQDEQKKEDEEKKKEDTSSSFSYQDIKYNPAIINLIEKSDVI